MPRPKKPMPTTRWSISLPIDLAAEVEILLADVFTGQVGYAQRSSLIEQLLRGWISTQRIEK